MAKILLRIAYPIIVAGLFVMIAFVALNYQSLNWSFYLVLFLLVIYIFLFGFAIGQNFASPVKKLLRSANELSQGDLKSRFYLESKDELGQLAQAFNRIAQNLEESQYENETMGKSVDMKVQARTQELEETISALEQKVKNRTAEMQKLSQDLERLQLKAGQKEGAQDYPKNQNHARTSRS